MAAWDFAHPERMQQNCASAAPPFPPNMLKERVLFMPSEFHSGAKHATTSGPEAREQRGVSGSRVRSGAVVVGV
jgi:hypothetical protein